ncbi:hypothetical protein GBA52_000264 [Prunus armeniaca]|nr:hypothetical protein GBA52_000264 [Prunus armeniaca]
MRFEVLDRMSCFSWDWTPTVLHFHSASAQKSSDMLFFLADRLEFSVCLMAHRPQYVARGWVPSTASKTASALLQLGYK